MGAFQNHKPTVAMFLFQFAYAGVTISTRAALLEGMSPLVFVVYRQAVATMVIAPIAYLSRRKSGCSMGLKSFSLIFLASLVGITINQNLYFRGLYLASSSMASAMGNLVPAVTFVIATTVGMEKVNIRSMRSLSKIIGTMVCVSGAVSMALVNGPKLLGAEILPANSFYALEFEQQWLTGCLFLFGSCCCWSIWLILQVPAAISYPDHLSLSAWMCFIGTILSAIVTMFLEPDPEAWKLHSALQCGCALFAGTIGSALSFFVQAWCISKRGPLFSAMFAPLSTVIVTAIAAIFLHEKIYMGSLVGAVCVIAGLYVVLWGKAEELTPTTGEDTSQMLQREETKKVSHVMEQSSEEKSTIELEEPLLSN